ncbi:ELWxxDGT repeat protein [Flagellimonas eckloniae]|uniref:Secretion system C-terminal sorting domain-containing protein n=1 Tax=Flagellimonas eckloniae TaxID=346185 RepID=A0A0Q0XIX4_9FLAO|nr:ELWxxDGT repeat protein [Allomuricauda eckloniae]KQC28663.1 hypothetical protein AAY42_01150 [Allomuricauda eckloniae]
MKKKTTIVWISQGIEINEQPIEMIDKLYTPFLLLVIFPFFVAIGQTLDAELLELKFSNDGDPERFTRSENGFYFTADDDELWFTDGTVDKAYLFATSNPKGDISLIYPAGDMVFFVAEANNRTKELWVSDGTEEGTFQLTDRSLSISQDDSIRDIKMFGNNIYFGAYDEMLGFELWVSDGSSEGTYVLKDINEGDQDSSPFDFFVFEGSLFFKAYTEELGTELWKSDGTSDGTTWFKDINEGDVSAFTYAGGYEVLEDSFYFFANSGINGSELWKSDGSAEGTFLLKDINQQFDGSSSNTQMTGGAINGSLIFVANDGLSGNELWVTDGTEEGTKILKDIAPDFASGINPYNFDIVFSGSSAFFYATDAGEENGLWISNGTTEGTKFLKEVAVSNLTYDDTKESVAFFGNGSGYDRILWQSDGTLEGTQPISEKATASNISSHENNIIIINGKIFFAAETEHHGIELWSSDGTDTGTSLFKDLDSSYGVIPSLLTAVGNQLFFRGNEYGYYGLCTSDGTIEGTKYLDINLDGQSIDEDSEFIDFNGKLVVSANDGTHGYELWISDGTQEGTKMIKDINPGSASSMYNEFYAKTFTVINDRLYFIADDGVYGSELWTSDGTESGTYRITDIAQGIGNHFGSYPLHLTGYNGMIYFSASDGTGSALYRTDGTSEGTIKLVELDRIEMIELLDDRLILAAQNLDSSDDSFYLWSFDPSMETIENLNMAIGYNDIPYRAILNEELFFYGGNILTDEIGILKTNGKYGGNILLLDRSDHPYQNFGIGNVLRCGGNVYFGVQEGFSSDKELWKTDGSVEGTVPIISEQEGVFNYIGELECFNGNLFFKQTVDSKKIYLTTGETDEVYDLDINVTNNSSAPNSINNLTKVGNRLFFDGSTEENGSEIYTAYPLNIIAGSNLTDSDEDGVIDLFDECPDTELGIEVNSVGCAQNQLDDDNDGITNNLDQCPTTLPNETVDQNGCSESDVLDTDEDGVNDTLDLCPDTPTGEFVDENGCAQSQLDDDEDGVMNDRDLCPETLPIYAVDSDGCPVVFELPANNFSIETVGVTCVDKNNGQLLITANENHDYTARVNSDDYNFSTELIIQNLYAGKYELCITIAEEPDYIKCFNFEIAEAEQVTGKSSSSISNQKLLENIEMFSGTAPYTVAVNGSEQLTTMSSSFSVEVKQGDLVQVMSKFPCEGVFERKIEITEGMTFAPNPTTDNIYIYMHENPPPNINVSIYNSDLKLVRYGLLEVTNGTLKVSLESLSSGMYYIRIGSGNSDALKIIKK